ncbi:LCCL domain-containing protein [Devosia sp. SL43]|uniref:LCCL domain-containing protein n=1 Tax=Devosia sp. SL43 TaxID=2806348 RepID=UPI001EFF4FB0|nr:LCCL domain-containing protein [Devosia sp. SL43]UJW86438.1 hypothetical protein IM737_04000 [Devosia sp. SL43]
MSSAPLAKLLSAVAVTLVLGQGALAQSSAKLGSPATAASVIAAPAPDPGSLFSFATAIGTTHRFEVVGATRGGIWGDGTYTSDSVLAVAAVHAGLLEPGQSGIVTVEIVDGLPAYAGSERHGVTSLSYGAWDVAYKLTGVELLGDVALPDPGDLSGYRGQHGTILKFEVTGSTTGSLWGDGPYTDDSKLAVAAVHAGVLRPGETGVVTVEILPGQASYGASTANGVVSGTYASWAGSFRIVLPERSKVWTKLSN